MLQLQAEACGTTVGATERDAEPAAAAARSSGDDATEDLPMTPIPEDDVQQAMRALDLQACNDIPMSRAVYSEAVADALRERIRIFEQGVADLRKLQDELRKDYLWNAGQVRELSVYLLGTAKLTGDLVTSLAGFSSTSRAVGSAGRAAIGAQSARALTDAFSDDAFKAAGLFALEMASDLHPIMRASNAVAGFASNVETLASASGDFKKARAEYQNIAGGLEGQIQRMIDRVRAEEARLVAMGADELSRAWMDIRNMCGRNAAAGGR